VNPGAWACGTGLNDMRSARHAGGDLARIGAFAALLRLLTTAVPPSSVDWPLLAAVLAAATMTLGNLAAFFRTSVKRLLAYSAISQAGYLLMGIAAAARSTLATRSLLFYLAAYAATNLGAFAVVTELPHAATLARYRGPARRHPGLAAVLIVCLLGLVGTRPPACSSASSRFSPPLDCCGLMQAAWQYAGVSIPRDTHEQWSALPHVAKASLQPGDIVFFEGEGHDGMYVGNGMIIDAPRTGEVIRMVALESDWYAQGYDGTVRS
jgi:Proton-conducting membrane transporter/NlpC/P60 family